MSINSVLDGLRDRRLAVIQDEVSNPLSETNNKGFRRLHKSQISADFK